MRKVKIPRQWSDITIENGTALDEGVTLLCSDSPSGEKIYLGKSIYINRHCIIDASESIRIGSSAATEAMTFSQSSRGPLSDRTISSACPIPATFSIAPWRRFRERGLKKSRSKPTGILARRFRSPRTASFQRRSRLLCRNLPSHRLSFW